jgi:hypothetical protein
MKHQRQPFTIHPLSVDEQRLQWANEDEAARKAATDLHFPDFDEHAEAMCDDRRTSRVWHDGVVIFSGGANDV